MAVLGELLLKEVDLCPEREGARRQKLGEGRLQLLAHLSVLAIERHEGHHLLGPLRH